MLEGVSSALDVGSDVYATFEPRQISFATSATTNIPVTDFHRIFIWDNLAAHHSRYVHNTVANRVGPSNFSIIPRPPYYPKYGPIEYKICEVMEKIRLNKEEDWDLNRLEQE
jgi:hypothetical protein